MAVRFYPTIWCDIKDCVEWISPEGRTKTAARMDARRSGWVYLHGQDICDRHRAEAGIPQQKNDSLLKVGIKSVPIVEIPLNDTISFPDFKEGK
jgi:hypothetical protein